MGGCLSKKGLPTSTCGATTKNKPRLSKNKHLPAVGRGAPLTQLPPSPPEEEAVVKEVLTETPTSAVFAAVSNSRRAAEDANVVKPTRKVGAAVPPFSVDGCRYGLDGRSEGEEGASEIFSASESFSVSTTLTEKRDAGAEDLDEETSAFRKAPATTKRRLPERSPNAWKSYRQRARSSSSPSGDPPSRRRDLKQGIGGGGGGGRSSPSPAKRLSDGRPFPGRDAASTACQRAGNSNAAARRGQGTRGRSASPAVKRVAACGGLPRGGGVKRSSPIRRTAGPGQASPERTPRRRGEEECRQMVMMREGGAGEEEEEEGALPPASEETLENPLVSMECFIFL